MIWLNKLLFHGFGDQEPLKKTHAKRKVTVRPNISVIGKTNRLSKILKRSDN